MSGVVARAFFGMSAWAGLYTTLPGSIARKQPRKRAVSLLPEVK